MLVNILFAFAYLSVLHRFSPGLDHTHYQCVWTMGFTDSKGLEEENAPSFSSSSSSFLSIHFFIIDFFLFFLLFSPFLQQGRANIIISLFFLSKTIIGVYGTLGLSPSSPTLGLLYESQVCRIRVSLPKIIKACSRCSSHVFRHRMSLFFLILT